MGSSPYSVGEVVAYDAIASTAVATLTDVGRVSVFVPLGELGLLLLQRRDDTEPLRQPLMNHQSNWRLSRREQRQGAKIKTILRYE
jgi:hypothetical protein